MQDHDPGVPDERGWSRRRAREFREMQRAYLPEVDIEERIPWRLGPVIPMEADGPNCPAHPSEPVFDCLPCSELGD